MQTCLSRFFVILLMAVSAWGSQASIAPQPVQPGEELLITENEIGQYGGRVVTALRSEPKTLNPAIATDGPSREVIGRITADLIHINRASQQTEPALAKSWKASPDGLRYTLRLRKGLRFSDGHSCDADDVVFSFQVYLDEKTHSTQRDLLIVGGKPIALHKIDPLTLVFELSQPYAAAERLFDSFAILPRHILEKTYQEGRLAQVWGVSSPATEVVGLGPFRLKEYVPGQQMVLERNPYYWKADRKGERLPYLDELVFLFVPSDDAQVIRFQAGDTDVLSRMSAENYSVLEQEQQKRGFRLYDLGPGLEYSFLFFNLNTSLPKDSTIARKQSWFKDVRFRQAVSNAIDREGIVRLVYRGHAAPLWADVTPAYKLWVNPAIPHPPRSLEKSRELLKAAGFSWKSDGTLVDSGGDPVEFSIVTSASNAQRTQIATIIQDDLKQVGMRVQVVPLEFRAVLDRVFQTHDFEASVLALGSADPDPNTKMNVLVSSGASHLWDLGESQPATPWEAEIDRLMKQQVSTLKFAERNRLYGRVQQLMYENLPLICIVSPNILVGAKTTVGNFRPAILDHYTLWNVDQLFVRSPGKH
ncbi:MAG TPA: ABC transporter substrate-binding protein [Terriglobales bacterium]|jgi:peptide/nickel transport system substrate-binding protein|nr:ABC transporter substrate-binding protein [Terriglobales bacterium]